MILTEDYALSIGVDIHTLVEQKKQEGFRETSRYIHPAVGLVIVMEQDYSLAS